MKKKTVLELKSGPGNPRNSEGAFISLRNGRILYIYSRYGGNGFRDDDASDLAMRHSDDHGCTWSRDAVIFRERGAALNLMSVSLLRLKNGRILLGYLEKTALDGIVQCRPWIIYSDDEAATWSKPVDVTGRIGIFVLNNDRIIQLSSGRLVLPVAFHRFAPPGSFDIRGLAVMYLSDDDGASWYEAPGWILPGQDQKCGLQEPGVVELDHNRIMCFCRTDEGTQYTAFSTDGGESWTLPGPSLFRSPRSPMSIKRNPKSGNLLAVWNDISGRWPAVHDPDNRIWGRNPLAMAVSHDHGNTWGNNILLENEPDHGYCYTAIHFNADGSVLLAYCCGSGGSIILRDSKIVRLTEICI